MATKPVEIKITAKDDASPAIKKVAAAVGDIDPAARRAGASADQSLEGINRRGLRAADGIRSISEQLDLIQKAFVVFQGGGFLSGLIQDAAATADEYNNLAARIKLATGEGEAFEIAMAGVQDIALRTNSSLQSTGTLFARLTSAGKSAGLSAQDAQEQALALTESINQAVQLSGASAQASDAALTQLIQGLQAGVLRGEEFNSVMEQSPRLAQALADGLGVTTGELRKLANEGRLTSDVVIQALSSQAQTLQQEFSTLPSTVGRAIQNLATSWTVYVGEADKATGASKLAAQAIDALAQNLDTVAGYLIDAGQAAAAFAALRLAQTFLGIGAAATTSATAIAANAAAMTAASAASAGAAAGVGRFAAILGSLKTFSLLGIVTNFQDIGTWIGEGIAKLQGYKDKTDELAQAERSRAVAVEEGRRIAAAQLAENRAAIEAQFQLSDAAKTAIAAFDDLVKTGRSAADAVAEIGKDFDLASAPGIVNASAVLDKLAADGKISAEQFSTAWATALKGEDLQAFEVRARVALAGTARESERLADVMDATLREAIRRSGADFDVLAGGMSSAARSAINDVDTIVNGMDRLKAQGVDTGKALETSLGAAIKTADGQKAIDALRSRVESLRRELGDKVADDLLRQIEEQSVKATGAIGGLTGALKKLGITSDADLKKAANETREFYEEVVKTGGSAREQALAFEAMAKAAIASGDRAALAFARSQASARGFEITTDAAGKTIVRSLREAADAASQAGSAVDGLTNSIQGASAAASEYVGWAERMAQRNAEVKSSMVTDGQGFAADASGNRIVAGGDLTTLTGITNFLKQAGVDEEQAKRIAREFSDGRGNIPYFSNPGQKKYGGEFDTISAALLKAAERATFGTGQAGGAGVGRTVQVKIDTGRGSETVNTDDAGAQAIVRSLQQAAMRAGR